MISALELRAELAETNAKVSTLLLYTDTQEYRLSTPKEREYVHLRLRALQMYQASLSLSLGDCWWEDPASR